MKTLRDAFGEALLEAGAAEPDLVVVDGDNSLATRTNGFRDAYPDRFVQAGVAEANLVGVAAGIGYCGRPVVASTFAAFLVGRALEVIRDTIALDALPVVIAGTHAGISVGRDGITHMALEDVAIMRLLPNMTVVVPSDEGQMHQLLPQLIAQRRPAYLRISRWGLGTPLDAPPAVLGRHDVLRQGQSCLIVATGLMVHVALEAADQLATQGIDCGVTAIHTVKPLPDATIREMTGPYGSIVVAEESWSAGSLFGRIAEFLVATEPKPCLAVGIGDVFPDGGSEPDLFDAYGLTAREIVRAVRAVGAQSRT